MEDVKSGDCRQSNKTLALSKVVYHALLTVIPNLDGLKNRWTDKGLN